MLSEKWPHSSINSNLKMVMLFALLFIIVTATQPIEEYSYDIRLLDQHIGACITFMARHNFNYNGSEKIRWRRDMKDIQSGGRITVSGRSLYIRPLMLSDYAYYQVIIEDHYLKVKETTNFWVNVKGCEVNQREEDSKQVSECENLCIDMCLPGWTYVPGTSQKCVQYFDKPNTWLISSEKCQEVGAELASIANPSENRFLASMLQTGNGAWIGLNDRAEEARYTWNFNRKRSPDFFTWGKDEPSNYNHDCNIENCVSIKKNGKWNDLICGAFNSYICEVARNYSGSDKFDWFCYGNKCYKYFRQTLPWHDALLSCKSKDATGKLATIFSERENLFVAELVEGNNMKSAWIGLNDIWEAGSYSWNKYIGTPIKSEFMSWDIGEPNDKFSRPFADKCPGEDCIQLKNFAGKVTWHDLSCQTKLPYLCEKIRERAYSTGAYVAMIIGVFILFSMVCGIGYLSYLKHERTAVKEIIKAAYTHDLTARENTNAALTEKFISN